MHLGSILSEGRVFTYLSVTKCRLGRRRRSPDIFVRWVVGRKNGWCLSITVASRVWDGFPSRLAFSPRSFFHQSVPAHDVPQVVRLSSKRTRRLGVNTIWRTRSRDGYNAICRVFVPLFLLTGTVTRCDIWGHFFTSCHFNCEVGIWGSLVYVLCIRTELG